MYRVMEPAGLAWYHNARNQLSIENTDLDNLSSSDYIRTITGLWKTKFGIIMKYPEIGSIHWYADFISEEDYICFKLKWS